MINLRMQRATQWIQWVICAMALLAPAAYAGMFDDDVARKQIVEQSRRVDDLKLQTETISSRIG